MTITFENINWEQPCNQFWVLRLRGLGVAWQTLGTVHLTQGRYEGRFEFGGNKPFVADNLSVAQEWVNTQLKEYAIKNNFTVT